VDKLAELEKEVHLVLEDQEKSPSATAPSSLRPRRFTEPSQPQINQEEHDQSGIGCGKSEDLGHGSPPRNQDQVEEGRQEPH
jgi:hypothetical protein